MTIMKIQKWLWNLLRMFWQPKWIHKSGFSFIFEDVRWIQTTFPKICWGFICKFANLWRRALNTNCPHLVWGAIGLLLVKIDSNLCPKSVLWAQRMLLFSLPDSLVLPHIVRRHMYSAITSPPQLWMDIMVIYHLQQILCFSLKSIIGRIRVKNYYSTILKGKEW